MRAGKASRTALRVAIRRAAHQLTDRPPVLVDPVAVRLIGSDPELKGVHMIGGLSNIGQHLPPKAADGSDLKYALECAFLTLAVPYGFDTVLGTPWRGYRPLPPDNPVLIAYRQFLEQSGSNALRAVRKFYRA